MEIDITDLVRDIDPHYYSASVAELGKDAGAITWANATDRADESGPLLPDDDARAEFRDYIQEFGAWNRKEIEDWTNQELDALFLQLIAGDMREREYMSPNEIKVAIENGLISSNLFIDDDGRAYYYIGV